jgi:hypothetical protein
MMTKRTPKDGYENQPVFMADLMAAVGFFLLHWGQLERNLHESIRDLNLKAENGESVVQGSIQDRLDQWKELVGQTGLAADIAFAEQLALEIEVLRRHRNLIAHGLIAGDARPKVGEPHILCAAGGYSNPDGGVRRYTLAELIELADMADRCRLKLTPDYRQTTSRAPNA